MKLRKGKLIKGMVPGPLGHDWERIAIVGTQNSGKTIFLTSLLSQLQAQAELKGLGVSISNWEGEHKTVGFDPFPFEKTLNDLLEESSWPVKTAATYSYRCSFETHQNGKKRKKHKFEFLDFPGERIADAGMYRNSYSEWSTGMLKYMSSSPKIRNHAHEFQTKVQSPNADGLELLDVYKRFMANAFAGSYSRQISPSTFILDSAGTKPLKTQKPEEWAKDRFSGLGSGSEFVPLPDEMKKSEFYGECRKAYQRYQKEVVNPLFGWLLDADQIYLLVDILGILGAGILQYNDSFKLYSTLLEFCAKRKQKKRNHLLGLGLIRLARINRVGIVVPKCDLVGTEEDVDRMETLVKHMFRKNLNNFAGNPECEILPCAAVRSTERAKPDQQNVTTDDRSKVYGYPVRDVQGKVIPRGTEKCWIGVSRVPEPSDLKNGYEARKYRYAEVYPIVPSIMDTPPDEWGLGKILSFMLFGKKRGTS